MAGSGLGGDGRRLLWYQLQGRVMAVAVLQVVAGVTGQVQVQVQEQQV